MNVKVLFKKIRDFIAFKIVDTFKSFLKKILYKFFISSILV